MALNSNLQHSWPSRDSTSGSRTSARLDLFDSLSTSLLSQNLQHSWPPRHRTSGSRTSARLDYFDSSSTSLNAADVVDVAVERLQFASGAGIADNMAAAWAVHKNAHTDPFV